MLILLLIIFIALTIWIFDKDEDTSFSLLIVATVIGVALVICTSVIIDGRNIDKKIDMYTEQNTTIENSISDLVKKYMEHEQNTFKDLKPESAITLVSLYPELNSNTLVEQQCNLYIENNKTITKLKESKINISTYKWWVYFGK